MGMASLASMESLGDRARPVVLQPGCIETLLGAFF